MQSILKALPAPTAGATLRLAFPWFYLFVLATAALAALLWRSHDAAAAVVMAAVALSTIPVRQLLMPAINRATEDALHNPSRLVLARPRAVCGVAFIANSTRYWPQNAPCIPSRSAPHPLELS